MNKTAINQAILGEAASARDRQTEAKIAVMQAHLAGKPIEWRRTNLLQCPDWQPTKHPVWDWSAAEYRVKVETAKSRRFLWRSPNGQLHTMMVTPEHLRNYVNADDFVEKLSQLTSQKFVRWIDNDWVEAAA